VKNNFWEEWYWGKELLGGKKCEKQIGNSVSLPILFPNVNVSY